MVRSRGGPRARRFLVSVAVASLGWAMLAAPVAADDPAPGDEPSTAIPIADIGIPQAYDTSAATANAADPTACDGEFEQFDGPFTNTFWHSFVAPADGDLIVDVNGFPDPDADGFLAILFVFEATTEGAVGPLVACNAFGSTVRFAATEGASYFAMTGSLPETPVGGAAEITVLESFLSNLAINERATYDQGTNGVTIHGTVDCSRPATFEMSAFGSQRIGTHTVSGDGFAFGGPCDGQASWSVTLFGFSTFFNPGALDVFVEVFACDTICLGDFGTATVRARPGKPVPQEPPPPPPANDERAGAFSIAVGDTAEQDTRGATSNDSDPTTCPDQDIVPFSNSTVWYTFTASDDGFVEVHTFGSNYDTTLFVLDGDTIVGCNDQAPGADQSQLTFEAGAGTTYLIMVGAWADSPPGALSLSVLAGEEPPPPPPVPANDERDGALPLVVDGPDLEAGTDGATVNVDTDPQECPFAGFPPSEHTVWYAISGAAGFVEVSTLGSDFDTTLYVLDGDTVVACNDDAVELTSRVVFEAVADTTYHVMVGTFNGSPGGSLVIRAATSDEPPPPPPEPLEFAFSFNDLGTVNTRTGEVTISGTATCSTEASGFMFASLFQEGGRFAADGFAEAELSCGPTPTTWALTLFGSGSRFQAGDAFAFVEAFVSTDDAFADAFVEQVVRLRPAGSAR